MTIPACNAVGGGLLHIIDASFIVLLAVAVFTTQGTTNAFEWTRALYFLLCNLCLVWLQLQLLWV